MAYISAIVTFYIKKLQAYSFLYKTMIVSQ
ncbi:hypothetical protein YERSI8AC_770006 [Enterobacterales bacterium 8AC]|nr:hypothetical protein YERSI8AC_770006 [Enterobacterales bacterium 8AC]